MFGDDRLGIPKVDVRSIGAGGGSIAWVDVGGLLHVGPRSAGAMPGPACYGKGGTEPTVTDANVILGIIDPDYYLGGRIRLDRAAAERAVGTIAEALGIDPGRSGLCDSHHEQPPHDRGDRGHYRQRGHKPAGKLSCGGRRCDGVPCRRDGP